MSRPEFIPVHDQPERSADDRFVPVQGNKVVLADGLAGTEALTAEQFESLASVAGPEIVLGRAAGEHWWTAHLPDDIDLAAHAGLAAFDLRSLIGRVDDLTFNVAGRATQIVDWHRDNRHCGRCGGDLELVAGERAMQCRSDGYRAYPRLSPAVIVLIERDGGEALLARNVGWPMPMYSTLAGFVEPGESLEDTIHREVREEVGIEVDNVQYFGSQPWPFPNSLMLGFTAQWAGGDLRLDDTEIADAQWYRPDDLPMIPPRGSIARSLIDDWIQRRQ